jgi:histidine ammonia-lyase
MKETVSLRGTGLTLDDVVAVARDGAVATLSPDARAAMQRSADLVEGF